MAFPESRPRRLRRTPMLRAMVQQARLAPQDLALPLFVADGITEPRPIESLPGHSHHTEASVLAECEEVVRLGIPMVLLFGLPAEKSDRGEGAWSDAGAVQRATRAIKARFGDQLVVATDLCLCEYTSHGHCGILAGETVDNDATLEAYCETAISQAEAGADIVAPSGMMDGQVGAIRAALDDLGYENTAILAYSAKMASAFYGPFRDAAGSTPAFGDRRAYQMDGANLEEALREVWLDIEEGADMVMVKPAGTVPRHPLAGGGGVQRAGGGLPGQRRVCDAQGGRRTGLAGPRRGRPGEPGFDPAGGREAGDKLSRQRSGPYCRHGCHELARPAPCRLETRV